MYIFAILYFLLGPGILLVSGENNASFISNIAYTNNNGLQTAEAKPTETLMMSMVKPTIAPKIKQLPSKAIILNLPPTHADKASDKTEAENQSIKKPNNKIFESHSAELKSTNGKPMQVSGFVTKNGSVFEITDLNGIGKIEGRQTSSENEKESNVNVCNYGSIVIYSDVPCDEVTDVKVSDVQETPMNTDIDSTPAELVSNSQSQQEQQPNFTANTSLAHDTSDLEHLDDLEIAEKLDQLQKEKRRRLNRNRRRKINPNRRRQLQNRRRYNTNRQRQDNNNKINRRGYSQQPRPYRRRQQQQRRQQQYRYKKRNQQNQKRRWQ